MFAAAVMIGAAIGASATEILPLEAVKPGMKGKGLSVFAGSKIEEFDVEILGILANNSPKRKAILARLSGRNLENTGILQGMSGSPVYIDGKLIGAVAFGFAYAKEPIAGITPIGEMLAVAGAEGPKEPASVSGPRLPFSSSLSFRQIVEAHRDDFPPARPIQSTGGLGTTLPVPLFFSGFPARILDEVRPVFAGLGFLPLAASAADSASQRTGITLETDLSLREGEPVAVQLVSGDLDLSAIGTVTHVDGARVFAFGHPLYNLGPVEYGMARAEILTVLPSVETSFKIGAVGNLIGTMVQDRTAGAYGEIGRQPKLVPLNLTLTSETGPAREFRLRLVADKLLTPLLLNMSIASVLDSEGRSLGDLTLELRGDVILDTAPSRSIHVEDLFTGNLGSASTALSNLVTAVVYYLTNNEFRHVGIQRIDLNIKLSEKPKAAFLERTWLDRYEVSPGETVRIKLFMKTYRGEPLTEEIPFTAPNLPSGSEFHLVVADTNSMQQVELGQYKSGGLVPRGFDQLVRLLNSVRKNNRIYFKLIAPRPGLFLRGEELPNLPPAMKALFASPRASGSTPVEINVSTLGEYQMPVSFAFEGLAVVPLKIKK